MADSAKSTRSYLPVGISYAECKVFARLTLHTGMIATVGALSMAFKRMQQRDAVGYQRWLRARVLAQGLTIAAIVLAGVQEMGVGVLTGNARPVAPPPTSAWESVEFEKRLKGAEEAHRLESGAASVTGIPSSTSASPPPTVSSGAQASSPPPQTPPSSVLSWLGFSRK